MTDSAVAIAPSGAALAEQVVIKGDLSKLSEVDRMSYYSAVCDSLGLNPLTRPFEYINLNGKLTLYATRAAADQLRATRGITITGLVPQQIGDLYVVTATGRDRQGREDSSTGAVTIAGLRGEALANAMMKAETKAKRRLTLSLAGLGWTDETEVDSIPDAQRVTVPALTLAEKAAQQRAQIEAQAGGSAVIGTEPNAVPDPQSQTGTTACGAPSPKNEPCELATGHTGDHRRGVKSWRTPLEHGRADQAAEPVAVEGSDGAVPASSDNLVDAARTAFGDDIAEGEFRADAIPADVQAGLDLLPANHMKGR